MADALGRLRMMVWGGRREEGSGWGTRVYLWQIHVDIQQNQYNIVKLKKKKKEFKKKIKARRSPLLIYSFTASSLQSRDLRLYLLSITNSK